MCSHPACDRPAHARLLCFKHYQAARADGSISAAPRVRREQGTGTIGAQGYHYATTDGVRKPVHVSIAEAALGKPLPTEAVVHHVDHDRLNNTPGNLVVCPSDAYHNLLHLRERAFDACGNANARRCAYCKEWDAPENLRFVSCGADNASAKVYHAECRNSHRRAAYASRKAA